MKVRIKVEQVFPDPTDYKRFSVIYEPQELYMEVDIPGNNIQQTETITTITEQGMIVLLGKLAGVASTAENNYLHSLKP